MRVISGSANRRKLVAPAGMDVRPTTDRIKETLFNIINGRLYDIDFLDMFAGSGAIGIEALSRGASSCVFIENSSASLKCIRENLSTTSLADRADVRACDAVSAVERLKAEGRSFDIIFMDPPYGHELEKQVLTGISQYDILKEDGLIIIEASSDTDFDYVSELSFNVSRIKKYGSNMHVFLER